MTSTALAWPEAHGCLGMSVARAIYAMRYQMMAFAEADVDADAMLSFDDFCTMLRPLPGRPARTEEQLAAMFALACEAGRGEDDGPPTAESTSFITFYDFFVMVLRCEAERNRDESTGRGSLAHLFRRFDKEGTYSLNPVEFGKWADEMGCLRFATPLFIQLDEEGEGNIDHAGLCETIYSLPDGEAMRELLAALDGLVPRADPRTKRRMPRRLRQDEALVQAVQALDTPELRHNLTNHLKRCEAGVADLLILLDERGTTHLSAREWREGMQRLGYRGSVKLLERVFAEATKPSLGEDDDLLASLTPHSLLRSLHDKYTAREKHEHERHAGHSEGEGGAGGAPATPRRHGSASRGESSGPKERMLTFNLLFEWLHGERSCLDARLVLAKIDVKALRFSAIDKASGQPRNLRGLDWESYATLRAELQRVCRDHELSPSELMWHCTRLPPGPSPRALPQGLAPGPSPRAFPRGLPPGPSPGISPCLPVPSRAFPCLPVPSMPCLPC